MRLVKIKGGLGNQMFQYAFAKLIAKKTGDKVLLDMTSLGNLINDTVRVPRIMKFEITVPIASNVEINKVCKLPHNGNSQTVLYRVGIAVENIINRRYYFEKNRAYRKIDNLIDNYYFDGYWQSWRYVNDVWDDIKIDFTPNYMLDEKTNSMIKKVQSENSVFVGVRRGDFQDEASHYGSFDQAYYDQAISIIEDRVPNPVFYIFSNDIKWVKENLNFGERTIIYREPEDIVDDFEDLILMSNCKHSVIINSTYHWWGARLKDNERKIVIAPKKWFNDNKPIDIVPEHWVRI